MIDLPLGCLLVDISTVELTKAQRAQATAQTAQMYIDMQVLQPDEVRQALAEDGVLNIEDILDK